MRGISMTLTLCVLAGFYWGTRNQPSADSAAPFHADVASAITDLPDVQGDWTVTDKPEPPPAAQQLLRPNALSARVMRKATGEQATFIVVQCKDSRDMAGHYPPNCYPAHGWMWQTDPEAPASISIPISVSLPASAGFAALPSTDGQVLESVSSGTLEATVPSASQASASGTLTIPYQVYRFRRPSALRERQIRIFSFFAIPGRGLVSDIGSVRKAAEDYRVRPYGAAQIQVIVDGMVPDASAHAIFSELMFQHRDLIHVLSADPLTQHTRGATPGPVVPKSE